MKILNRHPAVHAADVMRYMPTSICLRSCWANRTTRLPASCSLSACISYPADVPPCQLLHTTPHSLFRNLSSTRSKLIWITRRTGSPRSPPITQHDHEDRAPLTRGMMNNDEEKPTSKREFILDARLKRLYDFLMTTDRC